MLPNDAMDKIFVFAVAGAAANAILCCAIDGCETSRESISHEGKRSALRLIERNPNLARALREGLNWTAAASSAIVKTPCLQELIRGATIVVGQSRELSISFVFLLLIPFRNFLELSITLIPLVGHILK